ncbi:MAG: hypothetical protein JWQ27_264 [Ferruginibacter sp.]|nr:hypothetical protein [Ferruginibacter sp.]
MHVVYLTLMNKLTTLKQHLKPGKVYRRAELSQWSNAVDRHLAQLVEEGSIKKLSPGLYYVPRQTVFGAAPPDEKELVRSFLKDDEFLLTTPNAYNSLGVGTTQLYNKRVVYNHKRHGIFNLGGREFYFHSKHRFPKKLSPEFLVVDLLNNLNSLAEDTDEVLRKTLAKATSLNRGKLQQSVMRYGNSKTKALLAPALKEALHAI